MCIESCVYGLTWFVYSYPSKPMDLCSTSSTCPRHPLTVSQAHQSEGFRLAQCHLWEPSDWWVYFRKSPSASYRRPSV